MPAPTSIIDRLRSTPIAFMMALSFINYLGYAGWSALLYNFTIERAGFNWAEAGITQSVREIPGFLAFTAIFWLRLVREQALAYAALCILGVGVALTGQFPTLTGVLVTTFVMSVGFHYFETVNSPLHGISMSLASVLSFTASVCMPQNTRKLRCPWPSMRLPSK